MAEITATKRHLAAHRLRRQLSSGELI